MTQPATNYDTAKERYHSAPIGSAEEFDAFDEMTEAMFADQIKQQLTHRDGRKYGGSE